MIKRKKIFLFSIIVICLILLVFRAYYYLNACVCARGKAAYYAEVLMFHPEIANTIIPYEILSDKYKDKISSDEYIHAIESQELLDLYTNSIFQQNNERRVDISLSTEGYKKEPEGYFLVEGQWYYMKHQIDVKPNWLTLKLQIVRWYIVIEEKEKPENYP